MDNTRIFPIEFEWRALFQAHFGWYNEHDFYGNKKPTRRSANRNGKVLRQHLKLLFGNDWGMLQNSLLD